MLTAIIWGSAIIIPFFLDEYTEAQRGECLTKSQTASKWESRFKPRQFVQTSCCLTQVINFFYYYYLLGK